MSKEREGNNILEVVLTEATNSNAQPDSDILANWNLLFLPRRILVKNRFNASDVASDTKPS